jgi:hypothetical protein
VRRTREPAESLDTESLDRHQRACREPGREPGQASESLQSLDRHRILERAWTGIESNTRSAAGARTDPSSPSIGDCSPSSDLR